MFVFTLKVQKVSVQRSGIDQCSFLLEGENCILPWKYSMLRVFKLEPRTSLHSRTARLRCLQACLQLCLFSLHFNLGVLNCTKSISLCFTRLGLQEEFLVTVILGLLVLSDKECCLIYIKLTGERDKFSHGCQFYLGCYFL